MSTVAPEVRGAQPAPPVRHGLCRLTLTIDGSDYGVFCISPRKGIFQATTRSWLSVRRTSR
jgi:hypothetical protein